MQLVYRLKIAVAFLGLAAIITATYVMGDSPGKRPKDAPLGGLNELADRAKLGDEVASTRFSKSPLVTYTSLKGEQLFALQFSAKIDPTTTIRPRDLLVMIDTTASQAGTPMKQARQILSILAENLSPVDRIAVWTVNSPKATRDLTRGFQNRQSPLVTAAQKYLFETEYASGAADLGGAIRRAISSFDQKSSRQQVILYLGDGESSYAPLSETDRFQLSEAMVQANIAFYAVPLGLQFHPQNLHSLVSATGGAVVRVSSDDLKDTRSQIAMANRLLSTMSIPVLLPSKVKLPAEVVEFYPAKLPPVRADTPLLIAGKFAQVPAKLEVTVEGKVLGKEVKVSVSEPVPASQPDHFFLVSMVEQWRNAPHKEMPAMLRADRSLAMAYEQCRLAREELLTQAQWAIRADRLDAAQNLFTAAAKLDPSDAEAKAGLKVVEQMRAGKLTKKQLIEKALKSEGGIKAQLTPDEEARLMRVALQDTNAPAAPAASATPPAAPRTETNDALLRAEEARQVAREQQVTAETEAQLREARRALESDPAGASLQVKQLIRNLQENPNLSDKTRKLLLSRATSLQQEIQVRGSAIQQRLREEAERVERSRLRLELDKQRVINEEKIRERVRAFATLMNQARYEDAYNEALQLQREQINKGEPVSIEATAAYAQGLNATNLRETRELIRLREERYLMTMMQVEKSHIPYPDEPPVHYPPAAVWRELNKYRKNRYSEVGLGGDPEEIRANLELRRRMRETPVEIKQDGGVTAPLQSLMEDFFKDKYKIEYFIDEQAFKEATNDSNLKIKEENVSIPKVSGVSIESALRKMLDTLPPNYTATYLIRDGRVEITTGEKAFRDKAIRVFPVADLVIPIPSAVNQQALQQNLQVMGSSFAASFNGVSGNVLGISGIGGGFGFGLGGFNGAIQGIAGGGLQGGNAGFGGVMQGFQGGGCLNTGFGGGVVGFGGGQQGQFGNLGGQFGIQGGDQSTQLIQLIREVVDPGFWGAAFGCQVQGGAGGVDPMDPAVDPQQVSVQNQLGYYPPARALIVRGTSRTYGSGGYSRLRRAGGGAGPVMQGPGGVRRPGDALAQGNDGKNGNAAKDHEKAVVIHGEKITDLNPKKIWQKFLSSGVTDPGLVIAGAEVLALSENFEHAAELLKANLRQGIVSQPWVHEALQIALATSQAAPEELERANLSAIDLAPRDAEAYLKSAKAMAEMGDTSLAIRLCRQAAALQPDMPEPYVNSLVYAGQDKTVDVDALGWAATNLLKRDWPKLGSIDYHLQARDQLARLEEKLKKENRADEVKAILANVAKERRRDLVIELLYSGRADLDMSVEEPIGSVCSVLHKQTVGGGLFVGDSLDEKDDARSETYTAAEAFSGEYVVRIDRIWGRPLGNKATLKVTRHQGTPEQRVELITLNLDKETTTVKLEVEGRRKTLATPPILPAETPLGELAAQERERVRQRLYAMTSPTATPSRGMVGGIRAAGRYEVTASKDMIQSMTGKVTFESRVSTPMINGIELKAESVLLPDGQSVKVELTPVFQKASIEPTVRLPLIPGMPQ